MPQATRHASVQPLARTQEGHGSKTSGPPGRCRRPDVRGRRQTDRHPLPFRRLEWHRDLGVPFERGRSLRCPGGGREWGVLCDEDDGIDHQGRVHGGHDQGRPSRRSSRQRACMTAGQAARPGNLRSRHRDQSAPVAVRSAHHPKADEIDGLGKSRLVTPKRHLLTPVIPPFASRRTTWRNPRGAE